MKRRQFLQTSAVATVGLLTIDGCAKQATKSPGALGLQLYTLRDTMPADPKGNLKQVASFGYKELETYSYGGGKIFGMDFKEFGDFTKDLGMQVTSGHYGLDLATADTWEQAVADAKSIGQSYMVVPYLNDTERKSIDDYKRICEKLNKAGEVCNSNGVRFGYHNHAFEFETLDGQIPFDVMLAELDPKKCGMEMDIYWVVRAGRDPIEYINKYPGRFEQWHVKDMSKNNKDENADVGTGSIDYQKIFAEAKKSGMKHWYVEQESYPGKPIDSVAASAKYLNSIL